MFIHSTGTVAWNQMELVLRTQSIWSSSHRTFLSQLWENEILYLHTYIWYTMLIQSSMVQLRFNHFLVTDFWLAANSVASSFVFGVPCSVSWFWCCASFLWLFSCQLLTQPADSQEEITARHHIPDQLERRFIPCPLCKSSLFSKFNNELKIMKEAVHSGSSSEDAKRYVFFFLSTLWFDPVFSFSC